MRKASLLEVRIDKAIRLSNLVPERLFALNICKLQVLMQVVGNKPVIPNMSNSFQFNVIFTDNIGTPFSLKQNS